MKKETKSLLITLRSIKLNLDGLWYFNNGYFQHMACNQSYLIDFEDSPTRKVTFEDGKKGQILSKDTFNVPRMPRLKNVFLVNYLKVNMVSINQLCDQGMLVNFTKHKCIVTTRSKEVTIEGARTFNNCYKVMLLINCNTASTSELELLHEKLVHIYFEGLQRLVRYEAI